MKGAEYVDRRLLFTFEKQFPEKYV